MPLVCEAWQNYFRIADIHLLSQTPKSRHRRLSLCSLPVPKQFVESLGSFISFARSAKCRTWQSAHGSSCMFSGSLQAAAVPAFFRRDKVSLFPIHGKQIGNHLPGYGECRPIAISFLLFPLVDHSQLMALSWRRLGQLRPAFAGYACCAVWRAAYASPCPPSFVRRRRVHNN